MHLLYLFFLPSITSSSRNAYVTMHYEGTSRDDEYVLGISVLMQSLQLSNTDADLLVILSPSVSHATRLHFTKIGCKIQMLDNIKNPYAHNLTNPNFLYTLNKLHIWNLVEYDSIVYLDADNLILRNADELFTCPNMCAVFMNPCHFHTGLMVITPDHEEFLKLLSELHIKSSFDGADQGFLSAVYSSMLKNAPLFMPANSTKMEVQRYTKSQGRRLSGGYNLNHKYFYEQFHWHLFHVWHFGELTSSNSTIPVVVPRAQSIPALTLGFPMAPVLKPWYWYAAFILDIHWVWQDVRNTVPHHVALFTEGMMVVAGIKACGVMMLLALACSAIPTWMFTTTWFHKGLVTVTATRSTVTGLLRTILVIGTYWIAFKQVPALATATQGVMLFILLQHLWMILIRGVFSNYLNVSNTKMPLTWTIPAVYRLETFWHQVLLSMLSAWCIVVVSCCGLHYNMIWKMIVLAVLSALFVWKQSELLLSTVIDVPKRERNGSHLA